MSKTIFVTGAATGIGLATVSRFAAAGWNVVATTRREGSLPDHLDHPNIVPLTMDVTLPDQVATAVEQAVAAFGRIDVVVNNAGVGEFGLFEGISDEKLRRSFDINMFGVMTVMKAVLPHFRARQSGIFVNISSTGGRVGMPGMSAYLATKFALEGFSEAVWYELASQGVAVKLVEPGGVETPFLGKIGETRRDNGVPADYADFVQHNDAVMAKLAWQRSTPEEIADVVFTAATDGSSRLRYFAGPGVAHLVKARTSMDDEAYETFMRTEFQALSKL
ncbi:SDR family oxidoreductase [Sphingobium sp.]|uniref:SDR family oxidoreductase n=1 Tax=Sphingobium sp. TaxID=1912891 RepID=UPI003B3B457C